MPSIKDQSTVEAIAVSFCEHRCKSRALQAGGYSKYYSERAGLKLFTNVQLIDAIGAIDEVSQAKSERTVQSIDSMQQAAYDLAMGCKQPSAAVSAGTAIARLYGMDKDAGTGAGDTPEPLSKKQLEVLRKLARAATDTELAGPKLSRA